MSTSLDEAEQRQLFFSALDSATDKLDLGIKHRRSRAFTLEEMKALRQFLRKFRNE